MKSTANKTIPFKQRSEDEKNIKSKYKINAPNSKGTFKVIPYPKYKKKKEKGLKFIKDNKTVFIVLGLLLFFGLIFFLDNVVLKNKLDRHLNENVGYSNQIVSEKEFISYSPVINNKIKNIFNVSDNEIDTESMKKYGTTIHAKGTIDNSEDTLYFDMILENKTPSSLLVDGYEYIN